MDLNKYTHMLVIMKKSDINNNNVLCKLFAAGSALLTAMNLFYH